ncbi:MAG: hypothetical protein EA365_10185 [Gloeocapsa sp. DLM2.Bin57]|nr:MAG: hypothetical protein EA365_10185 [Gloeocapsa sp. DLM2.Bin57]
MKRFLTLFCLVLSLLVIGGSLKLANQTTELASVVVDGEVIFNLRGGDQALVRAKIANQLIQETIKEKKPPNFRVIPLENQAILQIIPTNQNLLIVTPEDVVNEIDAVSQAKLWGDRLQISLEKAIAQRSSKEIWRQLTWTSGLIILTLLLSLGLLKVFMLISPKYHCWIYLALGSLWTVILIYSSSLFPQLRSWRYQLLQFLQRTTISGFSLWEILLLLATLYIYSLLLHQILKVYQPKLIKSLGILLELSTHLIGWAIIAQFWGLELGLIILGLGLLVLVIANQYSSSLIINLEQPFQVGDLIQIDDLIGTVVAIGLTNTEIATSEQTQVIIPNQRFISETFTNWTKRENTPLRLTIPIAVSYGTDIKKLKSALLEAVKNHPDVLNSPRPVVFFEKLEAESLQFQLLLWIEAKEKQLQIKSELRFRIEASLRRYQIELTKYQQDIYLKSLQIEQWFKAWLIQQGFKASHLDIDEDAQVELTDTPIAVNSWLETITLEEIKTIAQAMRNSGGLLIKEHQEKMNIYPYSFKGSQGVDWLVKNYHCNRNEAIALGQILVEKGIIHHVLDQYTFLDSPYLYRFYSDEKL